METDLHSAQRSLINTPIFTSYLLTFSFYTSPIHPIILTTSRVASLLKTRNLTGTLTIKLFIANHVVADAMTEMNANFIHDFKHKHGEPPSLLFSFQSICLYVFLIFQR